MDTLIYHDEIADGNFPDSCVRCGAGGTLLTPIVLTTSIPVVGGSFQSQEVALPMCSEHVKAPLVSLNYPAVRQFTEEGIVVKNVSAEFIEALKRHRELQRQRRQQRGEPEPPRGRITPAKQEPLSPERQRAYRLFIVGCIVAAILAGLAIGGIVLLIGPKNKNQPRNAPPPVQQPNGDPHGLGPAVPHGGMP